MHSDTYSSIINNLNWLSLQSKRQHSCLVLFSKKVYNQVDISSINYLTPLTRQSKHNHHYNCRLLQVLVLSMYIQSVECSQVTSNQCQHGLRIQVCGYYICTTTDSSLIYSV